MTSYAKLQLCMKCKRKYLIFPTWVFIRPMSSDGSDTRMQSRWREATSWKMSNPPFTNAHTHAKSTCTKGFKRWSKSTSPWCQTFQNIDVLPRIVCSCLKQCALKSHIKIMLIVGYTVLKLKSNFLLYKPPRIKK